MFETGVNDCASLPCQNNGACINEINQFTCHCTSSFTGVVCETSAFLWSQSLVLFKSFYLDINECASGPCQNNGTCADGFGVYTCNCKSGYTGDQCETSSCCLFSKVLLVEVLLFIQIVRNAYLCLAKTAELASMELTYTRVSV